MNYFQDYKKMTGFILEFGIVANFDNSKNGRLSAL